MLLFSLHLFLALYTYRLYHKTMITLEPGFTAFLIWFHQVFINLYWVGDWDWDDICFLTWKKFWIFLLIFYIILAYFWFHIFHRFVFTRSGTDDTCLKPIFYMQDILRRSINNNLENDYTIFLKNEWHNSQEKYSKKRKFDLIVKIKIVSVLLIFFHLYFLYIIYVWFSFFFALPITPILMNFERYYAVIFLKTLKFYFFISFFISFIAPNTSFGWIFYYFPFEPFELYSDLYRRHEINAYLLECYGIRDSSLNWDTLHKFASFKGRKRKRWLSAVYDDWDYFFSSRSRRRYHLNKTWYSCYNPVVDCFVNNYYFKFCMSYQWILKLFYFPYESYAGWIYDKKRKVLRRYYYSENFIKIILFGRNYTCHHGYDKGIKKYKIK